MGLNIYTDYIIVFCTLSFQCSFFYCDPVIQRNMVAIQSFIKKVGKTGSKIFCYHEPIHPEYAVKEVISKTTVVHAMLWPSLCLFVGIIILMGFIFNIPFYIQKRLSEHSGSNRVTVNLFGYQLMKRHTAV